MVLAIGVGVNQAGCQTWINNHRITHPVLADPSRIVWNRFGMGYVPHNAVMDCNAVIVYTNYGFYETQIRNLIQQGLPYMVQFDHLPILSVAGWEPFEISAEITANSAFSTGYPKVIYRTDGGLWASEDMNSIGEDIFVAEFPGQMPHSTFDYYFRAEQVAGCPRSYPGQNNYYSFTIGEAAGPSPTPNPPTATPEPTPTPTPECLNDGDVNQDNQLSAADAQLTFMITLGSYTPTEIEACSADCNGDGSISSADAQDIFLAAVEGGSCADPL